jgi:hypothetical protein
LFADKITRWTGNEVCRDKSCPPHKTTCSQAEVLYPKEISTEFIEKIYVAKAENKDEILGIFAAVGNPAIEIIVKPSMFAEIK